MNKFLCVLLVFSVSCSFKKGQLENQTMKGHNRLYSEPEMLKLPELLPHEKRIVIASTNDVHGNYRPNLITFKDKHHKDIQQTRIGGVDVMNSYFKILRETYSNVVLVDSGDIFSNAEEVNLTREFYSFLKYDALTVGLRDFNLKVPAAIGASSDLFQSFAAKSDVPLLFSNLYDLKTARGVEWKGTKSHHIKDVGGVRVGMIGLIPDDIVAQSPVNNRVGLFVENMLQSTLRHARLLRSLGADIIVVMTHQGLDCFSELASEKRLPPLKVNFEPLKEGVCETQNVLGQYLERLPPHLVDVVIGGRHHHKMANYVNGILVMSGFPNGKSFNYAELVLDTKTNKIITEKTLVHQPVMFCHEFFKKTDDCFTDDPSVDHKERVPATFLGKPIERDLKLEKKFPGLGSDLVTSHLEREQIKKVGTLLKADLSFAPESSGETQLVSFTLNGKELIALLEEDYNFQKMNAWYPNPYRLDQGELIVHVKGNPLREEGSYQILTDLESLQNHPRLLSHLNKNSIAIPHYSWKNPVEADILNSSLAAQTR